jgi:hypothetical protein
VALGVALVAVGTRETLRALAPGTPAEVSETPRAEVELDDVEAGRAGDPAPHAEPEPPLAEVRAAPGGSRRAAIDAQAVDAPLEKHAAVVFEGAVRSASGAFDKPVRLELLDPNGGTATNALYFERETTDGRGVVAPFKLIRLAGGAYVLRPTVADIFEYDVQPAELRLDRSTSGIDFLVRDDVEHLDLDVRVLGPGDLELAQATLEWQVYRGQARPPREREFMTTRCTAAQGPELRGVPVDNVLRWRASAQGHQPMLGVASLAPAQRALEIRLRPGWGVFLQDTRLGASPVGEIVLDGRLAGTTDPSGLSYVEAEAAPRVLQVWVGEHCVLQHPANSWRFPVLDYHSEREVIRAPVRSRRD